MDVDEYCDEVDRLLGPAVEQAKRNPSVEGRSLVRVVFGLVRDHIHTYLFTSEDPGVETLRTYLGAVQQWVDGEDGASDSVYFLYNEVDAIKRAASHLNEGSIAEVLLELADAILVFRPEAIEMDCPQSSIEAEADNLLGQVYEVIPPLIQEISVEVLEEEEVQDAIIRELTKATV